MRRSADHRRGHHGLRQHGQRGWGSEVRSVLTEFTERRCEDWGIPTTRRSLLGWDAVALDWRPFDARLPYNPSDDTLVLLAPLNLLRRLPWINYGDYYRTAYAPLVLPPGRAGRAVAKPGAVRLCDGK